MPKFSYVTLFAEDIAPLRAWYTEKIGLAPTWESEDFVMLTGDQGASLGIHQGTPLSHPERVQLHFEVPDVDAFYEQLQNQGISFRQAPQDTPWGYRVAVLADPAGHSVEIYTPSSG
jgi:catechol 2,3-dioxygenase-like lactoylglutathione lyase family enzyme